MKVLNCCIREKKPLKMMRMIGVKRIMSKSERIKKYKAIWKCSPKVALQI